MDEKHAKEVLRSSGLDGDTPIAAVVSVSINEETEQSMTFQNDEFSSDDLPSALEVALDLTGETSSENNDVNARVYTLEEDDLVQVVEYKLLDTGEWKEIDDALVFL